MGTSPTAEEQAEAKRNARERAAVHGGITADDLTTMTPEEIVKARREGRLLHLGYAGG
jgi:hypothetical protein